MTSTETPNKVPKGRSPSFPGISLKTAVERAQKIWDAYKQFPQPVKTYTDAWGYKSPKTGPASVTFAAMRKYGLVLVTGNGDDRTAKLTDLAVDIIMKPDPLPLLQHAALLPPIHKETWQRFGNDVPSAEALRYEFVRERGFTETGLTDFLREYRETIAFAQLSSSVTVDGEDPPVDPEEDDGSDSDEDDRQGDRRNDRRRQRRNPPSGDMLSYAVPVALGEDVTIEGKFPLSETEWAQFMAVLSAMKPALVGQPETQSDDSWAGIDGPDEDK
jgi:hypothetical protein